MSQTDSAHCLLRRAGNPRTASHTLHCSPILTHLGVRLKAYRGVRGAETRSTVGCGLDDVSRSVIGLAKSHTRSVSALFRGWEMSSC